MSQTDGHILLKEQYKLAIDARNKLNDDFHKWMTYYYVANGAVLVAVLALFKDSRNDLGLIGLGIVGMVISMFWNLSCKGYSYWSLHWIKLIKRFERNLFRGPDLAYYGVYVPFSKEVAEMRTSVLIPNRIENVSTPKLTMMFSYFSVFCWLSYSLYRFIYCYTECCDQSKFVIASLFLALFLITYAQLLPEWAKSRERDHHILVDNKQSL